MPPNETESSGDGRRLILHQGKSDLAQYITGETWDGEEILDAWPWTPASTSHEDLLHILQVLSQPLPEILSSLQFLRRLEVEADRHRRLCAPLTLLIFGLASHPESPQQGWGNTAEALARLIRLRSRRADLVARNGHDGVALLLPGLNLRHGTQVAWRLLDQWRALSESGTEPFLCGVSVGISALERTSDRGEELLRDAYDAYLRACESGAFKVQHVWELESLEDRRIREKRQDRSVVQEFPRLSSWSTHRQVRGAFDVLNLYPRLDVRSSCLVAEGALVLAEMVQLNPDEQGSVAAAALVRDIGMTMVPSRILTHTGPLQSAWKEFILDHPRYSTQVARQSLLSPTVERSVRHHHEWVNGQGYPDGISGDEIPVGARIIALVDAYHAMTSRRPYRVPLSAGQAGEQLKKGAGTQFDPFLVSRFLESAYQSFH